MASFVPLSSRIVMRCQVGTTAEGAPKLGSLSVPKVDPALAADKVEAVVTALGGLLSVPVVESQKSDVNRVLA